MQRAFVESSPFDAASPEVLKRSLADCEEVQQEEWNDAEGIAFDEAGIQA